jgi:biuret amidohydrolase
MVSRTAVLALHYQNDVLHADGRIRVGVAAGDPRRERVVGAAARLLQEARARNLPIIHVRIAFRPDYADCPRNMPIFRQTMALGAVREGDWGSEFLAPLAPLPGGREFIMTHTRISAFVGTTVEQTLRTLGATRLVLAGVATHSVVESTVRDAGDRGFDLVVAADACASASPAVHDAALASMALMATIADVAGAFAASG